MAQKPTYNLVEVDTITAGMLIAFNARQTKALEVKRVESDAKWVTIHVGGYSRRYARGEQIIRIKYVEVEK